MAKLNWLKRTVLQAKEQKKALRRRVLIAEGKLPLKTRIRTALARETFVHWKGNSSRLYTLKQEVEKSKLPKEQKAILIKKLEKQYQQNLADAFAYADHALEKKAA